jgi:YqaJ-like viral recombinase domain
MPDPNRKTISATESPALLNASPYMTRWMLWQKFANGIEPERKTSERMEWGKEMQPLIIKKVAHDRKLEVFPNEEVYVRRGLLGCTRDATIVSPDAGPGALEIKCVFDYSVWMKKWGGGKSVPREIEIQLQQQMYVGNDDDRTFLMSDKGSYQWGLLAVWVCAEMHYFERKPIGDLWTKIEQEASYFFDSVERLEEPDPFGVAVELPLLAQLFPTRPDSVLDLSANAEFVKAAEDVSMLKTMNEQAIGSAAVAEELRARLLAIAKDFAFVKLPCGVSYRVKKIGRGKTIVPFVPEFKTVGKMLSDDPEYATAQKLLGERASAPSKITGEKAQHEALVAAAKALVDVVDWGTIMRIPRTHTNEDVIMALEEAAKAIAVLRAAGIHYIEHPKEW